MFHSILAIELYVYVLWLPLLAIASVMAGMLFRTAQLRKSRKKVLSLENEMMKNHAEILKLQQKIASFEKSSIDTTTPVVPIMDQATEEKKDKPDLAQHKKAN